MEGDLPGNRFDKHDRPGMLIDRLLGQGVDDDFPIRDPRLAYRRHGLHTGLEREPRGRLLLPSAEFIQDFVTDGVSPQ